MFEEDLLDEQVKKKKRRVLLALFILLLAGVLVTVPLTELETPATVIAIEPGTPFPPQVTTTPLSATPTNNSISEGNETATATPSQTTRTPATTAPPAEGGTPGINRTATRPAGGTSITVPGATATYDRRTPEATGIPTQIDQDKSTPTLPATTVAGNTPGISKTATSVSSSTPTLASSTTSAESRDTPEVEMITTRKPGDTPAPTLSLTPGAGTLEAEGTPVEVAQQTPTSTLISQGEDTPVKDETPASAGDGTATIPLTATLTTTLVASTPETSMVPPDQLPITGVMIKRELSWPAIGVLILLLSAGIKALRHNPQGKGS